MHELANGRRRSTIPRDLEVIPAFRQHLAREGLSFAQWQELKAYALRRAPNAKAKLLNQLNYAG